MDNNTYTLRARVIEGTIPLPLGNDDIGNFKDLSSDNFEIMCSYTKENFTKLFQFAKEQYEKGNVTKFEIMGWAGGAANEDGNRFLWSFRPELTNFEGIPEAMLLMFDRIKPHPMTKEQADRYEKYWRPLKFGFSLASYESLALGKTEACARKQEKPAPKKKNPNQPPVFSAKTTRLLYHFESEYMESGYMYSGSLPFSRLYNLGYRMGDLKPLISAGLVQKRGCEGDAFELTASKRKQLIDDHNLTQVWNESAGSGFALDVQQEFEQVCAACPSRASDKRSMPPASLDAMIQTAEHKAPAVNHKATDGKSVEYNR